MFTLCISRVYTLYTLSNRQREQSKYYRCNNCTSVQLSFFKPSCVCHGWRCGVIMCARMIYYFKMGYNRTHVWHLMGANQPGDKGCPLKKDTIGRYLSQIRDRVAVVGLRKMLQVRLAGPCQADESFVRTKRKHNVGRINPGRKHTLVIPIYVLIAVSVNVGVMVEYPLGLHCVYNPLNPLCYYEVLGIWDSVQKCLVAVRIPDRSTATMRPIFHYFCNAGIQITTDAWKGYNFLRPDGWRHLMVVHKRYGHLNKDECMCLCS